MNDMKDILIADFIRKFAGSEFVDAETKTIRRPGSDYHIHLEDLFSEDKVLFEISLTETLIAVIDPETPNSDSRLRFEKWLLCCEIVYNAYNELLNNVDITEFDEESEKINNTQIIDKSKIN